MEIDFAANLRQSSVLAGTHLPSEWDTVIVHTPNVAQVRAWCQRLDEERVVVNGAAQRDPRHWSYSWFQSLPDLYASHLNTFGNRLAMMECAQRRGAYRAGQAVLGLKYAMDTIEHVRFQADRMDRDYRQLIRNEEQQFPI
jgi:hypothetical protein